VFTAVLESDGVEPYPGSVAFLDALTRRGGVEVAVVSSSKNARPVLAAAGLLDRFDIIVDGVVAAERGIAGKPRPTPTYTPPPCWASPRPARSSSRTPTRASKRGRAGHFGLVLGVDRGAGRDSLLARGADIVVEDLGELVDDVNGAHA
jgi:beta-phosphoglucomutase-like phosphatase (HAD superfamily)